MMPLLLLLACLSSSDDSPVADLNPRPFCRWTDDTPCTDANVPQPLDGELLILHICLDYDSGLTACSGGSWRMFSDGTWTPSQCGEGFWYRACIAD